MKQQHLKDIAPLAVILESAEYLLNLFGSLVNKKSKWSCIAHHSCYLDFFPRSHLWTLLSWARGKPAMMRRKKKREEFWGEKEGKYVFATILLRAEWILFREGGKQSSFLSADLQWNEIISQIIFWAKCFSCEGRTKHSTFWNAHIFNPPMHTICLLTLGTWSARVSFWKLFYGGCQIANWGGRGGETEEADMILGGLVYFIYLFIYYISFRCSSTSLVFYPQKTTLWGSSGWGGLTCNWWGTWTQISLAIIPPLSFKTVQ